MKLQIPLNHSSQWVALITLTRLSGILSFAGSSLILFMIFVDRINKWQRIHFRLLTGLCFYDILYSLSTIVSTAAIPKDTEALYNIHGNIGNTATCKAQGFFIQLGMLGITLYLVSLSLYYLLVIRYNVNDDVIQRKVEPFMHFICIALPLSTAIAALCLNLYHQKLFMCWIEAKPWGCAVDDSMHCTEGANAPWYEMSFAGAWIGLAFILEVIFMGLIYATVRKREQIMNTFAFRGRDGRTLAPSSTRVSVERRDTAIQALLYISAFLFTYMLPFGSFFMYHVRDRGPDFTYLLLSMFFVPLLGFWNFLAFMRPRYLTLAREHRNTSFAWKMKTILLSRNPRPTRSPRLAVRRRSSAASAASNISIVSNMSAFMFVSSIARLRFLNRRSSMEQHPDPPPQALYDGVPDDLTIFEIPTTTPTPEDLAVFEIPTTTPTPEDLTVFEIPSIGPSMESSDRIDGE